MRVGARVTVTVISKALSKTAGFFIERGLHAMYVDDLRGPRVASVFVLKTTLEKPCILRARLISLEINDSALRCGTL